ncbi:MAG: hypothetical protein AB1782_05020 [Cyanobacteriota bacterium]
MISITSSYNKGESLALQKQKEIEKQNKIAFEGLRTDRNMVKLLADPSGEALFRTKSRQIEEAIVRLSKVDTKDNIEFLLAVAENLQYGVRKGSLVERYLSTESSIANKDQKQNVNWENLLKAAILQNLSKYNGKGKADLEAKFEKIFPQVKDETQKASPGMVWLSVDPNVKLEKELIKYRNEILNSDNYKKGLSAEVENQVKIYSQWFKDHPEHGVKDQVKTHLDYFIASSEATLAVKAQILKKLADFMSDEYKINPQLEERKLQVLSEMINDLVVKLPGQAMLTIKDMLQKHGTCASISTSRKNMAHQHKLAYVENLLAELDNKPTMEIWDPTDPKNEAKIITEKANIDWKAAFAENYRIVDAAVTNWMHIADNSGNGLTKAGQFVPFDVENYGMFRDSHLMVNMDPEHQPKYDVLRACIKLKGAVKKLHIDGIERQEAKQELKDLDVDNSAFHSVARRRVESALAELAKETSTSISQQELHSLADQLINPTNLKNKSKEIENKVLNLKREASAADEEANKLEKEGNLSKAETFKAEKARKTAEAEKIDQELKAIKALMPDSSEGPKVKQQKLAKQIQQAMPKAGETEIAKIMETVFNNYTFIEGIVSNEEKLTGKFNLKGQNGHNQKLFTMAAYYRVKKEFEVKVPERLEAMAKELNVAADPQAVLKKLEDQGTILPRATLDKMYHEYEQLDRYLEQDIKKGDKGWMSETKRYEPFKQFKNDFKAIENQFSAIRREVTRDYKELNKDLDKQLDEIYEINGRGEGHFWVGEEGGSGLNTGQYSCILKQLSGKDQFVEGDVKKALDHIESGKPGGVTGTMVEHYEYSGHAQYVYDVKKEDVLNPDTGKVEKQRVLYHDNTWGHKELRHTWEDDGGHGRTDYGSKRGGPFGYLLQPELTNGTTENDLITAIGINKPDKAGKKWAEKLIGSVGQEYPMFMDIVLEGPYLAAEEKAHHIVSSIFKTIGQQSQQKVDQYLQKLMIGNVPQIENFANELSVKLNKIVLECAREGNIDSLAQKIESEVISLYEKSNAKIFKPGANKVLINGITNNIAKSAKKIMASDQSDSMKQVALSRVVENIVKQVVYDVSQPGQTVQIKKSEFVEKETKRLEEQLLKLVRGSVSVPPGVDPDTIKVGGLRSKEDFDAIPENHILKVLLTKMALIDSTQDNESYIAVDKSKTPEDFEKARKLILEKHKNDIRQFFGKSESSVAEVKEAFVQIALEQIKTIETEENVDFKSLSENLIANTDGIIKSYNGSLSQFEQKLNSAITKTIDQFIEDTKGGYPSVEAKLKELLPKLASETIAENFRVSTMKEQSDSFIGKMITEWIDTKFDPRSDEQFLEVVKKLQNMKSDTFNKLLEKSSAEELGLKVKDPFEIVQRLRGLNSKAEKAFSNAVRNHVYNEAFAQKVDREVSEIIKQHKEWAKTEEGLKVSPEERDKILNEKLNNFYNDKMDLNSLYRNMNVEMSYIGMEKFVKKEKQVAMDKYGVRPSFPIIRVASDEQIQEAVKANLANIEGMIQQFGQLKLAEEQYSAQLEELSGKKPSNQQESVQIEMAKAQIGQVLEQIKEQGEQAQKGIKTISLILTKAMIRPRHQDDIMRMLNQWAKETSMNPGSELSKHLKDEILAKATEDHVFKHPDEFLDHITKTIPTMVFNKDRINEIDQQVFNMWHEALTMCLRAANKSYIEFKIKENVSKGKMPQVAKKLRDPEIAMLMDTKTHKGYNFDSKKGIGFLLQVLQDPANNNSTLKYFVQQAGLTKTALNYFLDGTSPEAYVKRINMLVNSLNKTLDDNNLIQDVFEQFIETLYESLEKAGIKKIETVQQLKAVVDQYFNVLDDTFAQAGKSDSQMLAAYKKGISEGLVVVEQTKAQPPEGDALNFLLEWQEQVLQSQEIYTEEVIEKTIVHMNDLIGRKNGIDLFGDLVPAFDPIHTKINQYKIRLDDAAKTIDQIRDKLQKPILDKVEKAKKEKQEAMKAQYEKIQSMSQEEMMAMVQEQAQEMLNTLIRYINQGEQAGIQASVKQILQTDNPIVDELLVQVFDQTDHPIIKTYMAGMLAEKGYLDVLADYASKAIDEKGTFDRSLDVEKDQALILAVSGLVNGTMTPDNKYNAKMANLLGKIFIASCDHQDATPLMDQLLNNFLNLLVNKGPAVQNMLIKDIINNKDAHINAKCVAIDILGRYETMSFMPIFEQGVLKPETITDSAVEQLFVVNVAMKSLFSFANRYPEMADYSNILNQLKAKIPQMAKNAKAEKCETDQKAKNELVKELNKRINIFEEFLAGGAKPQAA